MVSNFDNVNTLYALHIMVCTFLFMTRLHVWLAFWLTIIQSSINNGKVYLRLDSSQYRPIPRVMGGCKEK